MDRPPDVSCVAAKLDRAGVVEAELMNSGLYIFSPILQFQKKVLGGENAALNVILPSKKKTFYFISISKPRSSSRCCGFCL